MELYHGTLQRTTSGGQGGQEESQGEGGTELASGQDKESGVGSDDSKMSQSQKEQKPGSSDSGQGKQLEKLDTQTASGGKETGGQTASSGSGEESMSGPEQQQTGNTADQGKADSKVADKQGDCRS